MMRRLTLGGVALVLAAGWPGAVLAAPMNLKSLSTYPAATFNADRQLETIVGTTAGASVTGNPTLDPAQPTAGTRTINVDPTTLNWAVTKRDQDMQQPQYLDTAND